MKWKDRNTIDGLHPLCKARRLRFSIIPIRGSNSTGSMGLIFCLSLHWHSLGLINRQTKWLKMRCDTKRFVYPFQYLTYRIRYIVCAVKSCSLFILYLSIQLHWNESRLQDVIKSCKCTTKTWKTKPGGKLSQNRVFDTTVFFCDRNTNCKSRPSEALFLGRKLYNNLSRTLVKNYGKFC